MYFSVEEMFRAVAEAIRPPERLSVSAAAEKYRKLNNPGHYVGPWNNTMAPYLIEPMDVLTGEEYTGMIFVGPARTGKSDMFFNWLAHTTICDPADMLLVHMTQNTARDWSQGDLRKVFRHSPDIGSRVMPGRQNMNVHDIRFLSGMRLLVKWPTITELSGKTIPRGWAMDYDRMPADIDKEGNVYDLMAKRGTTFGRHAMFAAESSPGYEIENPRWLPNTPHEAPPTQGILALYNRGDRRRRYWLCADCGQPFEPDFKLLSYPDSEDHVEASEMATLDCPYCGFSHTHDPGPGQPGKNGLDQLGKWVKDTQQIEKGGVISGEGVRSPIASFWLKGPAAAFVSWQSLVFKYLKAMEEFEKTGSTEALKVTVNTDHGNPFLPPSLSVERSPEDLKAMARDDLGEKVVPEGVRFLIATVDVQRNRFEVAVWGFGMSSNGTWDVYLIDRFNIKKSRRKNADDDTLFEWVAPASYVEDWQLLVDEVIERTYPLADGSGRRMSIKATACDSGGSEGVTPKAYDFWRWLRDDGRGHHLRFQLLKGAPNKDAPRVKIDYPDSDRKDRKASARGEIPLLFINSNMIKDQINGMLGRKEAGNQVHFPSWLPNWVYSELCSEIRNAKGQWERPGKARNETWDLLAYAVSIAISARHARVEMIDWDNPPNWAGEWDENPMIFQPEIQEAAFSPPKPVYDFSKLAEELG